MTQRMIDDFRALDPDNPNSDADLRRAVESGVNAVKRFIVHEGTGVGYAQIAAIAVEARERAIAEGYSTTVLPPDALPIGTLVQFQRGQGGTVFDGVIAGYWFRLGDELKYRVEYQHGHTTGTNHLTEDEFEVIG